MVKVGKQGKVCLESWQMACSSHNYSVVTWMYLFSRNQIMHRLDMFLLNINIVSYVNFFWNPYFVLEVAVYEKTHTDDSCFLVNRTLMSGLLPASLKHMADLPAVNSWSFFEGHRSTSTCLGCRTVQKCEGTVCRTHTLDIGASRFRKHSSCREESRWLIKNFSFTENETFHFQIQWH